LTITYKYVRMRIVKDLHAEEEFMTVEKTAEQNGPITKVKYTFENMEQVQKLLETLGASVEPNGAFFVDGERFEQAIRDAGMTIRDVVEEEPLIPSRPARRSRK